MSSNKCDKSQFDKFYQEMKKIKTLQVKAGVAEDVGSYPNGQKIADVGRMHEFGTDTIPQRSFIRNSIDANANEINKHIKQSFNKILDGKSDTAKELNKIGIVARNYIIGAFNTNGYGSWTELKPNTIKRKKEDNILMDTGKLKQSITSWVGKK